MEISTDSYRKSSEKSNETNPISNRVKLAEIQLFEVEKVRKPLLEKTEFKVLPQIFAVIRLRTF